MVEVVVNIVLEQLIGSATEWLKEEISLFKGVKTELHNMISKMQIIQKVLEDAENQSVKEKYVKLWLEKLQDVSYDMDDVLDEWKTRLLIQKREEAEETAQTTCKFPCLSFKQLNCFSSVKQFPWRHNIAFRIKDINERMNLVFSEMEQFKLVSKAVGNDDLSKINNHNNIGRTTTSFIDEAEVYGRVRDKNFLSTKILLVNREEEKRLEVISIVGLEDSNLGVELVIQMWMAHGFLNPRTEEDEMVKTGQKYLKFLVSRAFLEERQESKFSMHDIIHSFALYLSGDELLSIMVDDTIENGVSSDSTSKRGLKSTNTRHSILTGNLNPTAIGFDLGKLRTCIIVNVPPNVTADLLQQVKMVRALYLKDCDLKQLPENIVKLIHLRVLYLSDNPLVELPEAIGNLYNLQQLSLERLDSLSSLPHSLGKLTNLIFLIPGDLALEKAPESLGKLINLQNLGRVQVDAGKTKLGLLMDLNQLRGILEVEFNSDYGDEVDAKKAAIGRKKHVTG